MRDRGVQRGRPEGIAVKLRRRRRDGGDLDFIGSKRMDARPLETSSGEQALADPQQPEQTVFLDQHELQARLCGVRFRRNDEVAAIAGRIRVS